MACRDPVARPTSLHCNKFIHQENWDNIFANDQVRTGQDPGEATFHSTAAALQIHLPGSFNNF